MVLVMPQDDVERRLSNQSFSLDLRSDTAFGEEDLNEFFHADVDEGENHDAAEPVDDALQEVRAVAKSEYEGVRLWKLIVLLLMAITAVLVSTGTYIFLRREEDDDYTDSVRLVPRLSRLRVLGHFNHPSRYYDVLVS